MLASVFEGQEADWLSRLDNVARERMRHLRCLCFVRPSPDSIQLLIDEIREPKYGEYIICEYCDTVIVTRGNAFSRLQQCNSEVVARKASRSR